MAGDAGAGGLSALGWVVVAGGVAVAGAAGLYFSGVLTPKPDVEQVAETAPEPVSEPASVPSEPVATPEPAPEPPATEEVAAPDPVPEPEPEAEPQPQDAESEQTATTEPEAVAEPEGVEPPEPVTTALGAPALDTIRIEPDGTAILAGKAEPGSNLSVRLDGQEIERATVDRSGAFALFLTLPFSDVPRGLSLTAERDGQTAQSEDYLLAALPEPKPVHVAQAQQEEAEQEPETVVDEPAAAATGETYKTATADPNEAEPADEVAEVEEPVVEPELPASETSAAVEAPTEETEPQPEVVASSNQSDDPAPVEPAQTKPKPQEPQAVAILKSDEEGVALVQSPVAPEDDAGTAQIALDTIGYSDAGEVQLTGRATRGALVRVYLDNLAVSDIVADTQGRWRGQLDDVSPGIYTLRVDELGPGDVVLSRLETPFKREAPEVLAPKDPEPGVEPENTPVIRAVTVQKGDTLWAISRERYGDGVLYVRVFEANRDAIRNPDLIYPGQVFNIPE